MSGSGVSSTDSWTEPEKDVPAHHVALLILAVVAVKAVFVVGNLPSMWVWGDEILYYTTAFDLVHPGAPGVPHPGFLNYPPLSSLLIAPVHLAGVPNELGYPLSLVLLSLTQALGVLALYKMVFEVFGLKSKALLVLLLVGPPAYMGLCLMSENLFVALYLWLLYFYVRQLKTERAIYAVYVGLLIAAIILTRRTGIGLFASVLASAALGSLFSSDKLRNWRLSKLQALTLGVAGALVLGWKLFQTYGLEADYGYLGPSGYLERGLMPAFFSSEAALLLARKFLANLSYISLATYGFCVPLVLWCVFLRRPESEEEAERQELLRRLMLHVVVFALFAAFAAALHMYINRQKPNPRYLMYGRYLEYFSPLLLALSFGCLASIRRWRRPGLLAAGTIGFGLFVGWAVPFPFFDRPSLTPNNMGVGWIFGLAGESPRWAVMICPLVALLLVILFTAPIFTSKILPRRIGYLAVLGLAIFNLTEVASEAAEKSQDFQEKFGAYSQFLTDHPELTQDGLIVDRRVLSRKHKRRDRWASKKVMGDHVRQATVDRHLSEYLGKRTILTLRSLDGYEVLFQAPGFSPKIYGTQVTDLGELGVQVGLERLATGEDAGLAGKRLGLVVHAASVTADGRHAIDVLRDLDLEVVRLFTPEHGLRGRAAAGEQVDSGLDPESGLPIVSLYGKQKKPRPEDLEGLDALVFDLQGAGVRFYTYVSTLILCLEAAAEAGIEVVVLDRPNPLGGERIEGPVAAPRDEVAASFVNLAPGPLVHGLTMGEMARWVHSQTSLETRSDGPVSGATSPDVRVVAMTGWQRSMIWADTGRPWVAPSPNLRSAEAAMAYPGVALLEATDVSEGRGTETPFLILGAPWVQPSRLLSVLTDGTPGFGMSSTRFTPRGSPAAPSPKFLDQECFGLAIRVGRTTEAQPYRLGLMLLTTLAREPEFRWRRDGEALTWLLGTPRVYRDLIAGLSVDEILAADEADHEAWREARKAALLY